MTKVTSKLQVTIPKAIADQYGIAPGDEIEFRSSGQQIRVALKDQFGRQQLSLAERLRLFDAARARQRERKKSAIEPAGSDEDRGWKREELYTRGHLANDHAD